MRKFLALYLKVLLYGGVLVLAFTATYVAMFYSRIFPAASQVVVYGREGCSATVATRRFLTEKSVPFVYADIDNSFASLEFDFQLNLSEARAVYLPLVLVNGQKLEAPRLEEIMSQYQEALRREERPS